MPLYRVFVDGHVFVIESECYEAFLLQVYVPDIDRYHAVDRFIVYIARIVAERPDTPLYESSFACPMCLDDVIWVHGAYCVLEPCGHAFCYSTECYAYLNAHPCPVCRAPVMLLHSVVHPADLAMGSATSV